MDYLKEIYEQNLEILKILRSKNNKKEKNDKKKELMETSQGKNINLIIEEFVKINPTINYGNTAQRKAVERIINKIGFEKTLSSVKAAISIYGVMYAPLITNPIQLENKFSELVSFYKKNNSNQILSI